MEVNKIIVGGKIKRFSLYRGVRAPVCHDHLRYSCNNGSFTEIS